MIRTVNGEISKDDLGIVLSHEHVFIDMRKCIEITGKEGIQFYDKQIAENRYLTFSEPYAIMDNALIDDKEIAVKEILAFKRAGGNSIVDCTLDEIGRDPEKLKYISDITGVNIIMGCGHYYQKAHFNYVKNATVEQLADEMRNDILTGINGTDIKSGIIGEIGTSAIMSPDEKKVLKAAGIVGRETGKAIHIHTDLYTENGYEIYKILKNEGVESNKICIDHIDVWLRPDYIKGLLDRGVFVEFDNFGKEFYVSEKLRFAYDLERVRVLAELIKSGYGKQILVSNDICLKTMCQHYGGNGYTHVLQTVKKMALESGISETMYNMLITENVKNFID